MLGLENQYWPRTYYFLTQFFLPQQLQIIFSKPEWWALREGLIVQKIRIIISLISNFFLSKVLNKWLEATLNKDYKLKILIQMIRNSIESKHIRLKWPGANLM